MRRLLIFSFLWVFSLGLLKSWKADSGQVLVPRNSPKAKNDRGSSIGDSPSQSLSQSHGETTVTDSSRSLSPRAREKSPSISHVIPARSPSPAGIVRDNLRQPLSRSPSGSSPSLRFIPHNPTLLPSDEPSVKPLLQLGSPSRSPSPQARQFSRSGSPALLPDGTESPWRPRPREQQPPGKRSRKHGQHGASTVTSPDYSEENQAPPVRKLTLKIKRGNPKLRPMQRGGSAENSPSRDRSQAQELQQSQQLPLIRRPSNIRARREQHDPSSQAGSSGRQRHQSPVQQELNRPLHTALLQEPISHIASSLLMPPPPPQTPRYQISTIPPFSLQTHGPPAQQADLLSAEQIHAQITSEHIVKQQMAMIHAQTINSVVTHHALATEIEHQEFIHQMNQLQWQRQANHQEFIQNVMPRLMNDLHPNQIQGLGQNQQPPLGRNAREGP